MPYSDLGNFLIVICRPNFANPFVVCVKLVDITLICGTLSFFCVFFFFETLELFLGPPSYTYPPYGVELNFWIRRVGVWLVECLIQREEKVNPMRGMVLI